jgi:GTP pyrophosphokinase
VSIKELTADENLPNILKKLSYNTLDDMYAAIGYGGVTALKVVGRLREDIMRIVAARSQDTPAAEPVKHEPKPVQPVRTKAVQGIIVEGMANCLVKFAKCCTPVPGDEVVGFITRGQGVSVHRCDCPNAAPDRRTKEDEGRWLKVSWADSTPDMYTTTVQVTAKDRMGLIVDVSTVLSSTKTLVSSLNARSTADGFGLIEIEIQVSDANQIQTVIRRLEQISGVMRVSRPAG